MKKLRVEEVIVVEGKYDAAKLADLVDGLILTTNGFSVFKNAETKRLLVELGKKRGIIVLTDSDDAGFRIRNYINKLAQGVLTLMRIDANAKCNTITEHELRTLVNVGHEEGVIESEERQMIYNVFDFGDSQAEDVMIPRIDVTFADVNSSYEDLVGS